MDLTIALTPEIWDNISQYLSPNEISCLLKTRNKSLRESLFSGISHLNRRSPLLKKFIFALNNLRSFSCWNQFSNWNFLRELPSNILYLELYAPLPNHGEIYFSPTLQSLTLYFGSISKQIAEKIGEIYSLESLRFMGGFWNHEIVMTAISTLPSLVDLCFEEIFVSEEQLETNLVLPTSLISLRVTSPAWNKTLPQMIVTSPLEQLHLSGTCNTLDEILKNCSETLSHVYLQMVNLNYIPAPLNISYLKIEYFSPTVEYLSDMPKSLTSLLLYNTHISFSQLTPSYSNLLELHLDQIDWELTVNNPKFLFPPKLTRLEIGPLPHSYYTDSDVVPSDYVEKFCQKLPTTLNHLQCYCPFTASHLNLLPRTLISMSWEAPATASNSQRIKVASNSITLTSRPNDNDAKINVYPLLATYFQYPDTLESFFSGQSAVNNMPLRQAFAVLYLRLSIIHRTDWTSLPQWVSQHIPPKILLDWTEWSNVYFLHTPLYNHFSNTNISFPEHLTELAIYNCDSVSNLFTVSDIYTNPTKQSKQHYTTHLGTSPIFIGSNKTDIVSGIKIHTAPIQIFESLPPNLTKLSFPANFSNFEHNLNRNLPPLPQSITSLKLGFVSRPNLETVLKNCTQLSSLTLSIDFIESDIDFILNRIPQQVKKLCLYFVVLEPSFHSKSLINQYDSKLKQLSEVRYEVEIDQFWPLLNSQIPKLDPEVLAQEDLLLIHKARLAVAECLEIHGNCNKVFSISTKQRVKVIINGLGCLVDLLGGENLTKSMFLPTFDKDYLKHLNYLHLKSASTLSLLVGNIPKNTEILKIWMSIQRVPYLKTQSLKIDHHWFMFSQDIRKSVLTHTSNTLNRLFLNSKCITRQNGEWIDYSK